MLAIMLVLALAISGGIFTGTIFFSAWKSARMIHLSGAAYKLLTPPLAHQ